MSTTAKAAVLLSGGLDSTTTLTIAKAEGFEPYALSFRYGQRHSTELDAASRVAAAMVVPEYVIADIDLCRFGGCTLTSDTTFSKGRSPGKRESGRRDQVLISPAHPLLVFQ